MSFVSREKVLLALLEGGLDGVAQDGYRGVAAEIEIEEVPAEEQHEGGEQEIDVPAEDICEEGSQS